MRTPLLMQFKKQKKTDKKWNDIKKISTSGGGDNNKNTFSH